MVGPGEGLLPADCLLRAGQPAAKPIVRSAVLATIKSWGDIWGKAKCTDEIVKHFADTDVHDALKLLCEVCGRDAPVPRHDSVNRPKGDAFANDIHDLIKELDVNHPVSMVFCAGGAKDYRSALDMIMVDIYPIPGR